MFSWLTIDIDSHCFFSFWAGYSLRPYRLRQALTDIVILKIYFLNSFSRSTFFRCIQSSNMGVSRIFFILGCLCCTQQSLVVWRDPSSLIVLAFRSQGTPGTPSCLAVAMSLTQWKRLLQVQHPNHQNNINFTMLLPLVFYVYDKIKRKSDLTWQLSWSEIWW